MATLAEVNVRIGAEISQFQRGLRNAERELQRSAAKFNQLGNNLSLAVSLPLAAAGAAAFKFAAGFETATLKIENLVGVQGKELEDLKNKFRELGPVVGKTQTELADAALFITGAGLRGAEALSTLEQSAKASAIGLGDQTSIAKVAGAAVAAFAKDGLTAVDAIDKLLGIVKEGNAEASELAPVLGTVLPIASQLGITFDEVGANIATFTKLGVGASTAVDGLKSLLGNLLKPSEQASKELAKIGLTADDVRKSIKDRGLAATLQDLIKSFGGNTEGLARVFGDVQGLTNVLATAGAQGDVYAETLKNIQAASGGVNTAFEKTAQTAEFKLKAAFASLNAAGTEIGSAVVPVVVDLANAVLPLVQGFASLGDGTKKLVVGLGLAAAAAGPLFKIIGGGIQVYSAARSAVLSFSKALEVSQSAYTSLAPALGGVQAGLRSAALAWRALDTVAKATVVGAALAVVIALGAAFYNLSESMTAAGKAQKAVNDVQVEAQKNIAAERLEAERLTGILKSNTATYEEKRAALARLNQISPQYFSGLNVEKSSIEQINAAYSKYIENLLTAARAQAAQSKIVELEKERLDLAERLAKQQEKVKGAGAFGALFNTGGGAGSITGAIDQQIKDIEAQQKALAGIAVKASQENAKLQTTAGAIAGAPLGVGAPLPSSGGKTGKAAKSPTFEGFKNAKNGLIEINDAAILTNGTLEKLGTDILPITTENTNALAVAGSYLTSLVYDQNEAWIEQQAVLEETAKRLETVAALGQAVGDSIVQASFDGAASLEELAKAGANAARKFIAEQIAMGIASQVRAALGTGLLGLLLAPIAGAAAAGLFNRLIPKFAQGGIVTSPTLGIFGEAGPEVIFPLSELNKFVSSNSGAMQVYGRLDGMDILLSSERTDARRARTRGY